MPRVHTKTARASKFQRRCQKCGEQIEPGQTYRTWEFRYGGPNYQHEACGYPRRGQLTRSKMGPAYDAVDSALDAIAEWRPEVEYAKGDESVEIDASDLTALLEEAAEAVREVGTEYEESADNIEQSFQYGSPTADACREVAQEIETWADNAEGFDADADVEFPEFPEDEDGEPVDDDEAEAKWREECEQAIEDKIEEIRDEARALLEDLPEYQG